MKVSFVIPCYKSENTIEEVINEISEVMSLRKNYRYEIIAVNDSSPDNVIFVLEKLAKENKNLKIIDLAINTGKCNAVMAGYAYVTGDYVVNIDDDGQCDVRKLWNLIDMLNEGYDVIFAKYNIKKQSKFKNFGSSVNAMMSRYLLNKPKDIYCTNFSVFRRFVSEKIIEYKNPYSYLEGLILRVTKNIGNFEMEERVRFAGKGNFNFSRSLALFINGFTAFSVKPLRIATILGFLTAVVGFVFGIIVILNKLINPQVLLGYSSIMAVLLFLSGIIMIMLGMIGEYIGRIYICINNAPQYVIRKTYNI